MEKLAKYKWFILGYVLYAAIVLVLSSDLRRREYWNTLLIALVIIPIVIYMVYSFFKYRKANNLWPFLNGYKTQNNKEEYVNSTKDGGVNGLFPEAFSEAWPFMTFVNMYGPKVVIATNKNDKTDAVYHTCEISDDSGITIPLYFDMTLGELTSVQLKERKNELWVGKRKDNNKYYLFDHHFEDGFVDIVINRMNIK